MTLLTAYFNYHKDELNKIGKRICIDGTVVKERIVYMDKDGSYYAKLNKEVHKLKKIGDKFRF